MRHCPICRSTQGIRRSPPRGFWEERVYRMVSLRPFRCNICGHRFIRFSTQRLPLKTGRVHWQTGFRVFLQRDVPMDFPELIEAIARTEKELRKDAASTGTATASGQPEPPTDSLASHWSKHGRLKAGP